MSVEKFGVHRRNLSLRRRHKIGKTITSIIVGPRKWRRMAFTRSKLLSVTPRRKSASKTQGRKIWICFMSLTNISNLKNRKTRATIVVRYKFLVYLKYYILSIFHFKTVRFVYFRQLIEQTSYVPITLNFKYTRNTWTHRSLNVIGRTSVGRRSSRVCWQIVSRALYTLPPRVAVCYDFTCTPRKETVMISRRPKQQHGRTDECLLKTPRKQTRRGYRYTSDVYGNSRHKTVAQPFIKK